MNSTTAEKAKVEQGKKEEQEETTTETAAETATLSKQEQADAVTRSKMYWAMGAGLVPVPLFDIAVISGVQMKMLSDMSKIYEIPFSEHKVKNIISALIGGFGSTQFGIPLASLVKIIPVIGQIGSLAAVPVMAGASTYALGKVFIQHFESGGTFLDFDPAAVKEYFAKQFEEGKKVAENVKNASGK
ncbi:YcjF family protein [Desulfopila sp. IMCC35008]|uniref:YcjF family protein n=1 Tax=Desulfopila sp. IMCC35008 TaxID=2653858 RepID=UPI0013D605A1|nr:DUF697 domain-containing protein [Desulfopila sp. IMCC35008]